MKVLSVQNLNKRYGPIQAVKNFNLELESGQILGLLGPNGSGKTTTLGMLLGITRPDSGSFSWFEGEYDPKARLQLGALLETPNFYPYLTAVDNLKIIGRIKGVKPEIDQVLESVGLYDRRNDNFSHYSLGMKQRLAIAGALIGRPKCLIFDEPTNGLDPQGIAEIRSIIQNIAAEGKTILMASHILDEVEKICTHVAIMKKGVLKASGPVGALLGDQQQCEMASSNSEQLLGFIKDLREVRDITKQKDIYHFSLDDDYTGEQLNSLAYEAGISLSHLVVKKRSLESEFLEITQD